MLLERRLVILLERRLVSDLERPSVSFAARLKVNPRVSGTGWSQSACN